MNKKREGGLLEDAVPCIHRDTKGHKSSKKNWVQVRLIICHLSAW